MPRRILLVDDETEILEILGNMLTGEGFEVRYARTAEEFRRFAFEFGPHLIILDIMLAEHNGPIVYHHLLMEGLDPKVPVIFLSGLVQEHVTPLLSPAHHYAMHGKPFCYDDLLRDVRHLMPAA